MRIILEVHGGIPLIRKLSGPRALPVERPIGPQLLAPRVMWDAWCDGIRNDGNGKSLEDVALEWSAGAEVELLGIFGHHTAEDCIADQGMGMQREEIIGAPARSFRNTPDSQGILGHRLNWAVRQLHFVAAHAHCLLRHGRSMVEQFGPVGAARRQAGRARDAARARSRNSDIGTADLHAHRRDRGVHTPEIDGCSQRPWQYDAAMRIGYRAAAFLRERRPLSSRVEDAETQRDLNRGLRLLASLTRASRGRPPLLDRWCRGEGEPNLEAVEATRDELESALHDLASRRATRRLRESRRWAQTASLAIAHKVTKIPEASTTFSASASKEDRGALGPQEAADHGMDEWGPTWDARVEDITEEIMRAVEAVEVIGRLQSEVVLPPFIDERLFALGRKFSGRTAVGICGVRPRHTILLTRAARRALCLMLELIEKARRWPNALREVVEVALSKRTGARDLSGSPPPSTGSGPACATATAARCWRNVSKDRSWRRPRSGVLSGRRSMPPGSQRLQWHGINRLPPRCLMSLNIMSTLSRRSTRCPPSTSACPK